MTRKAQKEDYLCHATKVPRFNRKFVEISTVVRTHYGCLYLSLALQEFCKLSIRGDDALLKRREPKEC